MLIRLKVKGFKSLADVEVRFGPLTCVIGPNGAGKSNLLDAIHFLGRLADVPIQAAATGIRLGDDASDSISSLFTHTSSGREKVMEFEADLLVDQEVVDDSGRSGRTTATALRYALRLRHVPEADGGYGIQIESESLRSLPSGGDNHPLGFPASAEFLRSVYTEQADEEVFGFHRGAASAGASGSQASDVAGCIPSADRTLLSCIADIEHPTALAARREMQSWTVIHLQASALRRADDQLSGGRFLGDGTHLPSTLLRLGRGESVAHRLAALLPEVVDVSVETDERSQRKVVVLEMLGGVRLGSSSLSDGTLRLLALAALALDRTTEHLLCIEEPEISIHPASMRVIVDLFSEMVVDPNLPIDSDNPLRQIIFTTHAPNIVQMLTANDLLIARTYKRDGVPLSVFCPIQESWRAAGIDNSPTSPGAVAFGALLAYLEAGDADLLKPENASSLLRKYLARHPQLLP
jgi:predicted ATPase